MLEFLSGADPYVFYKMHHIERARAAWELSEELGLYEALRAGPATIGQVAARTGLHVRPTAILLACNACMGIVAKEGPRYRLYEIMREFVLEKGRSRAKPRPDPEEFWYKYTREAILTNAPVPEVMPEWLTNPQGDEGSTAFSPGRHGWRMLWGEALAKAFDFSDYRLVADLGGATGGVLLGLTAQYPGLRGVVMDLPYSRRSAEQAIAESGASDRVSFMAGDFFSDPLPEGMDVVFMSHIIHDWDDDHCVRLLRRCREALPSRSPVLVQEYLLNEDKTGPLLAVFQWFGLLFGTMGDQRTEAEIAALMQEAGLHEVERRDVDREQSIVIGWCP